MANPKYGDEVAVKRLVRYLKAFPRLVVSYPWQDDASEIIVFADSDWGGCVRSRRSTSGGLIIRGAHLICHWSKAQQLVALSSAEAELNASAKACQEALGIAHLGEELGRHLLLRLYGDSSANML